MSTFDPLASVKRLSFILSYTFLKVYLDGSILFTAQILFIFW